MSFASTFKELKAAASNVVGWSTVHFPASGDFARCFEFATMLDIVESISQATGKSAQVVVGPKRCFAGAPANRNLYNHISVGDYYVYLGVCFASQSGTWHAPDVVVAHQSMPDRPLVVVECKHYSGDRLPKPMVMAFVGLLCDLNWAVFSGCRKKNVSGLYPGTTLRELVGIAPSGPVCNGLNMCKSRLVTTLPVSEPLARLELRYEFEVHVQSAWSS